MKFIILQICLSLLFTYSLFSQALLVRTGASVATSTYVDGATYSPEVYSWDVTHRTGLVAGVELEIPLTRRIAFQPGLSFVQKGFRSGNLLKQSGSFYRTRWGVSALVGVPTPAPLLRVFTNKSTTRSYQTELT